MKQVYKFLLLAIIGISLFSSINADILYVKPGAGSSAWQGQTNVYSNLQTALVDALPGDQIWLAAGTYKPTESADRDISFMLKGVGLYGGFAGTETKLSQRNWRVNPTILSGDIGVAGVATDNSYHVLTAVGTEQYPITNSLILDGLIIEGGYANSRSDHFSKGGGLYLSYASPIIRNTWFRDNFASDYGGAVSVTNSSSAVFGNVLFSNNKANAYGGAVYNHSSSMKFHSCLFYGNYSEYSGGAIFNNSSAGTEVVNSIAWNNDSRYGSPQFNTNLAATNSLVQGGFAGTGNMDADPQFVDPINGDYRLVMDSPALNAGDPALVPEWLTNDFAGNERISDGQINMGLFEGKAFIPVGESPEDKALLSSSTTNVDLSWQIPAEMTEAFTSYTIEYIKNGNTPVKIENIETLNYTMGVLSQTDIIQWRVAGVLEDGILNWTPWRFFGIKREGPLYVSMDGTGDGSSWMEASNLQDALSAAVFGDQLWVAAGTYHPTTGTDRSISFQLKDGVEMYGGFEGNETEISQRNWRVNETILSGNIGNTDLKTDNSYHVIGAIGSSSDPITTETIVDGFFIEGGYANSYSYDNYWGGGILLKNASPIIRNAWFRNNHAIDNGGAVYATSASSAVFGNVLFTNNSAEDDGGAVSTNKSLLKFHTCLFFDNYANSWGGAVYGEYSYNPEVINSIAWNNNADYASPQFSEVTVIHSLVQGGYSGTGNLDANPMFIDPLNGDFRLAMNSPALHAGDPALVPDWLTTDYNGQARISDGHINMGILEGEAVTPLLALPEDKAMLNSDISEVELSWLLPEEPFENFVSYTLEYIKNDNSPVRVENIEELTYTISSLGIADIIQWRIAGVLEEGLLNWTPWRFFGIKREGPVYVSPNGTGDGSSWLEAMDLRSALAAAIYGDQLWVAAGTYHPTIDGNRNISFELKEGIEVYGGFAGHETELSQRNWTLNKTILSGDIGEAGLNTDNTYQVMNAVGSISHPITNKTILDGFIIEAGYANSGPNNNYNGGGLNLKYASPIIRNSWFRANYAANDGGALYATNASSALFGNVLFTNNRSDGDGGAIYSNRSAMKFHSCLIYDNYSNYYGGGIYSAFINQELINSIVWNNDARYGISQLGRVSVQYSTVQAESSSGGNLNADPLFNSPTDNDFRLSMDSPAIYAGNPELVPDWLAVDFAGNPRISDGKINMGILEGKVNSPIQIFPENKAILNSDVSEVTLSWQLPEEMTEVFLSYTIEYIKNEQPLVSIEQAEDLNYTLAGLNPTDVIQWRIAGVLENGFTNWSQWRSFSIKRNHPLYVTAEGTGSGTSWADAMQLQEALSISIYSDQIWLAAGTYLPTDDEDRSISFQIKDGFELYGGFAGHESSLEERNWRLNETILSGNIADTSLDTDNSYHVISAIGSLADPITNQTVLDGLIVEGGYADLSSDNNHRGGALFLNYASPLIRNTWFRENQVTANGGAIYGINSSAALFGNVLFTNNTSSNNGGAVYSIDSPMRFYNCLFYANYSNYYGGAIYDSSSDSEVINSIVWNNDARYGNTQIWGATVSYSLVQGGSSGTENINTNPLFIDASNGDFRLQGNSPALQTGSTELVPAWLTTDFSGKPRLTTSQINRGIHEGYAYSPDILIPLDAAVFESNTSDAELSWQMPEENAEAISGYQLEYSKNDGSYLSLNVADGTTYVLEGTIPGDKIVWRVAALTEDGFRNWSAYSTFFIRRDHPIFVKTDGNGDGSSWYDATSLQEALSMAVDGEQIWVATGTYKPTDGPDRTVSFELKEGVELYGGFAGGETDLNQRNWRINETILSGDIGEAGVATDNSYHVILALGTSVKPLTDKTIVDGFIVEGGYANLWSDTYNDGAGLYLSYASPIIRNSWFRENYAGDDGGAVSGYNSSSAIFENVLFTNNSAYGNGGAVYSNGSVMEFHNSLFYGNYSENRGGAIYNINRTGTVVINSIVWNNNALVGQPQLNYVTASHSLIQGGYSGTNNIDMDPLFMDAENGNFMLKSGSPAIDAGSRDLLPEFLTTDYLGLSRVQGDNVDMGPFESIVMVNTLPAHHGGARETDFFGIEFRWGLQDGEVIDESEIPDMKYRIQVWESGDEENLLHDDEITSGGFFITDYNTTNLFGFNPGTTYEWKIAMLLDGMEIWSDPTLFYIGHDHVIHVKEGSIGTTGANWDNAFGTLHQAIAYTLPGDEIWVAEGTYYPVAVGNSSAITTAEKETALQLKTGLSIYGGFEGTEATRNHRMYAYYPTIISGDLSGTGDYSSASNHLFVNTGSPDQPIERGVIIDGLTFEYAALSAIINNQASPTIRNSIFRNNRGDNGAGLTNTDSSPLLFQVLFHNNQATSQGGALWSDDTSMPELINATVGNNEAEAFGGVYGPASIKNSIVYHNMGGQVNVQASVVYSCIENGFEGEGNTSYDPTWVDMAEGDFRLLTFSSALDGGQQSLVPEMTAFDLANNGRLWHNNIDMGAYEAQAKGMLVMMSSSIGVDGMHKNDSITLHFNQPVTVLSEGMIQLTSNGIDIPVLATIENGDLILSHEGLEFGQAYQLAIQPGAIAVEANTTIINEPVELNFATKACEPVSITSLVSAVQVCPYEMVEITVQTKGDVKDIRWIFNNDGLEVDSDTLTISSIRPDQFGVYTVEIDDHCLMGTSQQVIIGSVETSTLRIIDKWETVFFVDNQSDQLSDYSWYLNNTFLSNSQFVETSNITGQLSVHALDATSGCVLRSVPIELTRGKRTAMAVWPNPVLSGNHISVLLPQGFEPSSLKLFDISGRLMVVQKVAIKTQFDFDKTDFIPGVYILQLEDEQGHREFERITIE